MKGTRERKIIDQLQSQYDEADSPILGEYYFAISMDWWRRWELYVSCNDHAPPGKMKNEIALCKTAIIGKDFRLVPLEVYRYYFF
jgi:hypothetical protein